MGCCEQNPAGQSWAGQSPEAHQQSAMLAWESHGCCPGEACLLQSKVTIMSILPPAHLLWDLLQHCCGVLQPPCRRTRSYIRHVLEICISPQVRACSCIAPVQPKIGDARWRLTLLLPRQVQRRHLLGHALRLNRHCAGHPGWPAHLRGPPVIARGARFAWLADCTASSAVHCNSRWSGRKAK